MSDTRRPQSDFTFDGKRFTLTNQASRIQGSIHDNEKAREFGFRRGIVPGTTISIVILEAIVEIFGAEWFEGGWHDLEFVGPAYDDEDLQVQIRPSEGGTVLIELLNSENRLSCSGSAGLGVPQFKDPPVDPRAFPGSVIGTVFPERTFAPSLRDSLAALRAAGKEAERVTSWCKSESASPWGKRLVPPAGLLPLTRAIQSELSAEGARPPGMNGRMQVAYRRPVFADEALTAATWLAGKASGRRTWSRTIGFSLRGIDGREAATGLHTIRWWAPES